ncbi:hypothetical protein CP8484711_1956, partial [Chlamydia psittaci 84-8471/1]
INYRRFSGCNS